MRNNQQPPSRPIKEGLEKGGSNTQPTTARPATPPGATTPQRPTTATTSQESTTSGGTTNQSNQLKNWKKA